MKPLASLHHFSSTTTNTPSLYYCPSTATIHHHFKHTIFQHHFIATLQHITIASHLHQNLLYTIISTPLPRQQHQYTITSSTFFLQTHEYTITSLSSPLHSYFTVTSLLPSADAS
jgi:hypothetical protein